MLEDFYNNTIEGQDWSQVSAVKNGKVFKEALGVFHWFSVFRRCILNGKMDNANPSY